MRVKIQNEFLTVTSCTVGKNISILYTENPHENVKVFIWRKNSCKLLLQFNKNSLAEIEYVEKRFNEWMVDKRIFEDKKTQNKKPNTHGHEYNLGN
ncbi:hypothetical protein ACIQYS_14425 [Psychrobacillus sp. NPDC096426]|uniref:hypothetical protein n=1 Tax=Psychrobacillus sp. NPDC096426 TaxID=3364491 RepID=UPI00382F723E